MKVDEEGVKGRQPIGHDMTRDMKRVTRAGGRAIEGPGGVKRQRVERQRAS